MGRKIHLETLIAAPPERCFDLSRSVDLHQASMTKSGERAVAGVTTGLMELGDTVTWEAHHLGADRRLTTRITEMDRPHCFVDEQVVGPFKSFRHVHMYFAVPDGTLMTDDCTYTVPFRWFGTLLERAILGGYMRELLETRNAHIKQVAENSRTEEVEVNA
jgi:ligand-binding SRPBCC domain-containing protein